MTIPFAQSDSDAIPYTFDGYCPLAGDSIERDGVVTTYAWIKPEQLAHSPEYAPHGFHLAMHSSGHLVATAANEYGESTRLLHGMFLPDGRRAPSDYPRQFDDSAGELKWTHELIRHIDEVGEYTWEAWVAVPVSSSHPGTLWSPAYSVASRNRRRTSSSMARHLRRLRTEAATLERFDPYEIYERDSWTCGVCHVPVDRGLRWPDPMSPSLDHVVPLVAGGQHSRQNTQLAHWICNVRKGATSAYTVS